MGTFIPNTKKSLQLILSASSTELNIKPPDLRQFNYKPETQTSPRVVESLTISPRIEESIFNESMDSPT